MPRPHGNAALSAVRHGVNNGHPARAVMPHFPHLWVWKYPQNCAEGRPLLQEGGPFAKKLSRKNRIFDGFLQYFYKT